MMGDSTKGKRGVLKLVHPGRHVEIHRTPITAAEIMSKNPRHCVARPDVFKFPYIVVRPESVLYPGQVFYIVPNVTIHKLLNSKPKVQNNLTPKKIKSPKHTEDPEGSDRRDCCSSYLEAWPMMRTDRNSYLEFRKSIREDSLAEEKTLSRNESNRDKVCKVAAVGNYGNLKSGVQFHKQVDRLKPCLKKLDCVRTSRDQKVTFAFPILTRSG